MTELDRTGRTVIGLFRDAATPRRRFETSRPRAFPMIGSGSRCKDASEARSPGAMT